MKIYGGFIDTETQHYEVFCVNCTEEGEKLFIEAPPHDLASVIYQTLYPCTYVLKGHLNTLQPGAEDTIKYVYGFDKLIVFNIIDTERRKALEEAQYQVSLLEKPVIIKGED